MSHCELSVQDTTNAGIAPYIYDCATLRSYRKIYCETPPDMIDVEHLRVSTNEGEGAEARSSVLSRDAMRTGTNALVIGHNAWSSRRKPNTSANAEFERKMRSMLNKLAPNNYNDIIRTLDVKQIYNDENKMMITVQQIFEKALQEPMYSQIYVNFCLEIFLQAPEGARGSQALLFKRQVINQTQREFEDMMDALAKENPSEDELTVTSSDKWKRRKYAIMKFIGELYLASILSRDTIKLVSDRLLNTYEEDLPEVKWLEMVCTLLKIVGRRFEVDFPDQMSVSMEVISELIQLDFYAPRIHFMLQDVLETRDSKWVARVQKADELHVEMRPAHSCDSLSAYGDTDSRKTSTPTLETPTRGGSNRSSGFPPSMRRSSSRVDIAARATTSPSTSRPRRITVARKVLPPRLLEGESRTDALKLNPLNVTDVRNTLLTVMYDFCLLGKREDTVGNFLFNSSWDIMDLNDALSTALSIAISEEAMVDAPRFVSRWLRLGRQLTQCKLSLLVNLLAASMKHCYRYNGSVEGAEETLKEVVAEIWDDFLSVQEKDKVDATQSILEGLSTLSSVASCSSVLVEKLAMRASRSSRISRESTASWFGEKQNSASDMVSKLKPYFLS